MSDKIQRLVEAINIDFLNKKITFKMMSANSKQGEYIQNIEKILNLDERFEAINKRLSLNLSETLLREDLKFSVILKDSVLTDINIERQEIVFDFKQSYELFDVEQHE